MITVDYIKSIAYELASHDDIRTAHIVQDLLDLGLQLEFLEERDTISDSRLQLLKSIETNLRSEIDIIRDELEQQRQINVELRKQVQMLKAALYK